MVLRKNVLRKFFCVVLISAVFGVCISAEESAEENAEEFVEPMIVRAGVINDSGLIPSVYMIDKLEKQKKNQPEEFEKLEISFEKFNDSKSFLTKLLKNEIDVGFLPINVAAKVYNLSNKSIVCAAVIENSNLVLITKDKNIKDISDLAEKTVYVAGSGAVPEYLFSFILKQNNLSTVNLDYSVSAENLPAQIISDKIQYAIVPEPFAAIARTKANSVIYALDLQKEYKRVTSDERTVPFIVVAARKEFTKQHPESVEAYLKLVEESVNWTVKNPQKTAQLCEKSGIKLSANIITSTISESNYVYVSAEEDKSQIEELLRIFFDSDKASVGDKLPDNGFFYISSSVSSASSDRS